MKEEDKRKKRETPEPRGSTPGEHDRESNETHVFTDVEGSRNATAIASEPQRGGFDWLALVVALVIAAFFALTARFNSQPSPSFIPSAVFSATCCGLLVTVLREVRRRSRA